MCCICYFLEGPALKRKPTPPKGFVGLTSEEEIAENDDDEQELVTVTKVVEEVLSDLCGDREVVVLGLRWGGWGLNHSTRWALV